MPKHPIYVALLPESAREVIGQTHPAGIGARRYLEAEGFRYDGAIDIFDAGPSLKVPRDDLRTLKDSRLEPVYAADDKLDLTLTALVSNNSVKNFRCVLTQAAFKDNKLHMPQRTLKLLGLSAGEMARFWIKR